MTNNNLTDERLAEIVDDGFLEHGDAKKMAAELKQRREADKNCLLYGIVDCDGNAYIDELCVAATSRHLDCVLDELNAQCEGGEYVYDEAPYQIVALYTAIPLTDSERAELQQYRESARKPANEKD